MAYCHLCGGHNPTCPHCGHANTTIFNRDMEIAPIVNSFEGGATFKGANNSHFTFDNNGFHETTEVPGLKLGYENFRVEVKTRFDNI